MSIFSTISDKRKIYVGEHFFMILDGYPVSPGHVLIISKEERVDYFSLNKGEKSELNSLIGKAKEIIEKDRKPDGYNIGMNCGEKSVDDTKFIVKNLNGGGDGVCGT